MGNKIQEQSKIKKIIYQKIRILQWLPNYTRTCFFSDLIAGITVGLTMMPQSIAYASIAELAPHYGLYSAIMGSFVYIFFGTVKQVSIGPSSLMSLLTFAYIQGKGIDFIVLLTFLAGCVELLMGLLNLGFLVDFISAPVTSGFTSATSLIIILAQLKNIFGIKYRSVGIFDLIRKLFSNLKHAKVSDTTLGIFSMIFLLTIRKLGQIDFKNEKVKKSFWYLSICRNALIVFTGSIIAFIFEYTTENQPFVIAGDITPGLPPFQLPNFSTTVGNDTVNFIGMVQTLGSSIFVIPIVAVLANVAIAKTFADGSVFDATQEMMTLGIANIMGSFVGAMPTTGAFTRSAVNNASNVQTPMGGLYAGTMILLALSFLTPYFYFIPKATIAAVLICAVMFMIEYWELPKLWRCNKFDFFICLITFISSLYYGVETGLLFGVGVNMLVLLKIWARPDIKSDLRQNDLGGQYLLIKPELGLLFPAGNYLIERLLKLSAEHPSFPVVLDCRSLIRLDYSGCRTMAELIKAFNKQSQKLVFMNLQQNILQTLKSLTDHENLEVNTSTMDVHDQDIINNQYNTEDAERPLLQRNIILYNNESDKRKSSLYDNV